MTPFEKLVQICPIFEIVNKTDVSQALYLKDNDSILAMPRSKIKVKSSLLLNMPDSNIFRLTKPTVEQLSQAGMLTSNETIVVDGDSDNDK